MPICILCKSSDTTHLYNSEIYDYHICMNCKLVFVDPNQRLSPDKEKERYDQHENDPNDEDYRNFLDQLFTPLNKKLPPNSYGLDYGAGPGPTLSVMLEDAGHTVEIYDPFYANQPAVLKNEFDFITSTETAEHFYHPGNEFENLWTLLKPGGTLGIMTLLRPTDIPLSEWHYINDETHVSLYTKNTFEWIAKKFNAGLSFFGDRVIILKKS